MTIIDLQMIIKNSKHFLTNEIIYTLAHVFILMLSNMFLMKKKNILAYII